MIVDLALKGASPDDLAMLRRLLVSDGLIDGRLVTAQTYAEPGEMGMDIDIVQFALNLSSVETAASVLALWLCTRKAEVEMNIEEAELLFRSKLKVLVKCQSLR